VLDYALTGPEAIHAVDANPRQNALLELKLAGIRRLEFGDFFEIFGHGRHPRFREIYRDALRGDLSEFARAYWDRNHRWFAHADPETTFYFHGLAGLVARVFRGYVGMRPGLRDALEDFAGSHTLEEQREHYDRRVAPRLWTRPLDWMLARQFTMSLLGVPHPQRKEVERQHRRGVAGFVRESLDYVARELPVRNNYFWTLYLRGRYSFANCPEYLKRRNFFALKAGLADRISIHTDTVTGFLKTTDRRISRYVLLDHMDWMSAYQPAALAEEWEAILERAAPGARVIFRSAHAHPAYLQGIMIGNGDRARPLEDRLSFHTELADELARRDRVHTYAGFHIADVKR
jgi:S-adenosylmethionine-diacylglycerol 3-amino-3-carboxypropyl transferase